MIFSKRKLKQEGQYNWQKPTIAPLTNDFELAELLVIYTTV